MAIAPVFLKASNDGGVAAQQKVAAPHGAAHAHDHGGHIQGCFHQAAHRYGSGKVIAIGGVSAHHLHAGGGSSGGGGGRHSGGWQQVKTVGYVPPRNG